ncbi:MAG TPA: hypothetical protein VG370_30955, partial [Chloroflexota bacterium]|nr:hypothetical protein [Chloroflexota bacterium]
MAQEPVGRLHVDSVGVACVGGKVPHVERDDDVGAPLDRGREDVAVPLLVAHDRDEILVVLDQRVREVFEEEGARAVDARRV